MHRVGRLAACAALLAGAVAVPRAAEAAGYKLQTLHVFCPPGPHCDQHRPGSGLVADDDGNLYGTAGSDAFMLSPQGDGNWQYTVISTEIGGSDRSPLIRDVDGNLYGTNASQILEIVPNEDRTAWTTHVLHNFCTETGCPDGIFLSGGLSYAGSASGVPYDGTSALYGTTKNGGAHGDMNIGGVVYRLTPEGGGWQATTLYDFCAEAECADGLGPEGGVVVDGSGNLFGTTLHGGTGHQFHHDGGAGTVFKLTASGNVWSYSVLYNFCSERRRTRCFDGENPRAGVILDGAGNLFGTTEEEGKLLHGGAYELTPNGSGGYDYGAVQWFKGDSFTAMSMDASGNLYGTLENGGAQGHGIVYRLAFDGGAWTMASLHEFCVDERNKCRDGDNPGFSTVLMDAHGNLFGTAFGGARHNGGTVFALKPRLH